MGWRVWSGVDRVSVVGDCGMGGELGCFRLWGWGGGKGVWLRFF
jgi:hypothetical protein